ncbi:histone-fold-containing protein [Amniculicola lignicola CBS 123094]|uniref:Histone H4 n=1 Tax=Amniculicola lignicola CBS 123094 TaxID=1392246 RepID=A0A6A5W3U9_9PLEO|nr:histone-fold-containing protein [Amniculicola lignicola CBS 123094]
MNEHSRQFTGIPRFGGTARPTASSSTVGQSPASRATQLGIGLGSKGLGRGKSFKRHKKVLRDTIQSVTKGDIRRLARRGGVKRMSANIYDDIRAVLKQRLEVILRNIVAVVEYQGRKTVGVTDVIFTLNRLGRPIYGFDPSFQGQR